MRTLEGKWLAWQKSLPVVAWLQPCPPKHSNGYQTEKWDNTCIRYAG